VVIPAPGSTYEAGFDTGFCGYHGLVEEGEPSHDYTYTFVPYVGEEPFRLGCIEYDGRGNADNVTSMAASHEYTESATDPGLNTWFTEEGYEIGDMCASGDDELPNGSWVQGLWDNHQSACSLSDPEPPHVNVVTEAGVSLEPHEVELIGVVDPEGLEAHYHFEYGATTSYGTVVPVPDSGAGSSSGNVSVSQTVKGLAEGVYHYRLVATNASGTAYGEGRLLISGGFSVQTLPDGSAGSAVGHVKASQVVAGLQPKTTYHDRIVASNAAGTTYGEDNTFTAAAPPPPSDISPPTISGSAVQGQALTETRGSWSNAPTSYGYQWEDCDSSGANCSAITGATGQTYVLTATDVGDTLRAQETASNAGGTGGAASSAATALAQAASSGVGLGSAVGGGAGSGSGGLGGAPGGQGGNEAASLASVSGVSASGDLVLVSLSCHGGASSLCTVTLTLTVVEQLRRGRLLAVSAATGRHRRIVIIGRETITLTGGESKLARVALNATGRRLLMGRHALAAKLTFSGNGVHLTSRLVRFKARHQHL
jgi:hypothetical protein